jgi:hypothetical protein
MSVPQRQLLTTMRRALGRRGGTKSPESLLAEMVEAGVIQVVGRAEREPLYDLAPAFADLRTVPFGDEPDAEAETDYEELMAA